MSVRRDQFNFDHQSRRVISFLEKADILENWPASKLLLINKVSADKPWIHSLPLLACTVSGGEIEQAIPVSAAWMMFVHAANLFDDYQDGDLECWSPPMQPEAAIPIALSWISTAPQVINDSSLSEEVQKRVKKIIDEAVFCSSLGKYQESNLVGGDQSTEDALTGYWEAVINKSGSILRAGLAAGAAVNNCSEELIEAIGIYGTALGVIRQVVDDCRDRHADGESPAKLSTLPRLLVSLTSQGVQKSIDLPFPLVKQVRFRYSGKKTILHPSLEIPDIIADILLEWRRRGLDGLHRFTPCPARNVLEAILEAALTIGLESTQPADASR